VAVGCRQQDFGTKEITMVQGTSTSLGALPPAGKCLLRLTQALNFGRVVFFVLAGQPDFTRPVRVVRTVRVAGGDNGARPEARLADFKLRREVTAALDHVARAPDGAQVTVKVEHGLPVLIEIEQEHKS
jgi:hypothetical protein